MKKIITVLLFVLILSGCSFPIGNNDAFITVGSYTASEEEYKIYLDETKKNFEKVGGSDIWETDFNGKPAEDVAKTSALNTLVAVKVVCSKADQYGVKTDDEMSKNAEKEANEYVAESNGKTDFKTVKKVMLEKLLYEKIKEDILSDFVISEKDYKNFCNINREKYVNNGTTVTVDEAYFSEKSDADNFVSKLQDGNDFKTVSGQLGISDTDEITISKSDFQQEFTSEEFDEHTCGILKGDKAYVVYSVKAVTKPKDEEITQKMRDDYKAQMENSLFEKTVEKWKTDFNVTKNEEKWKTISVK